MSGEIGVKEGAKEDEKDEEKREGRGEREVTFRTKLCK